MKKDSIENNPEPDDQSNKPENPLERLRNSAPAAILGAFTSFANAATGAPPKRANSKEPPSLVQINLSAADQPQIRYELEYSRSREPGGPAPVFRRSLEAIAIDAEDRIYALGDGEIRILDRAGKEIRRFKAPEQALCLTVDRDGNIYVGCLGRVEILDGEGKSKGGFPAGESGKPARVTSIKVFGGSILAADAAARFVRRFDFEGKQIAKIGDRNKNGGFMLPNRALDFDIDSRGQVVVTDPGRHRVSYWTLDGAPTGHFGKFGQRNPEDFVGCCNPVNLALAPGGRIVTAEKLIPRIKVYDNTGKLLALIGPEHFDPKCTHLYLAVDSQNRIVAADPVSLRIKYFTAAKKPGSSENV